MVPSTCKGASKVGAGERVAPVGCRASLLLLGAVGLLAAACTRTTKLDDERPAGRARVGVTQGSAVAVTQDERIAVVTNRSDGVVTIIRLDPSKRATGLVSNQPHIDIPFEPLNESKPWAAVIGADDDTAYVLLRGLRRVVKISGLHGRNPRPTETTPVGSEPTAIVISPSGRSLYVANWGDGTVSSIILSDTMVEAPLDLNRRLSDEMLLGRLVGNGEPASAVWTNVQLDIGQRKGLAHPRALAVTDNGDTNDFDETLYATEFFAQPLPGGGPGGPDDLDHSREGLVYPILLETNGAPPDRNVVRLKAVDLAFKDGENGDTGCFPNQLYSAAASGDRLYVTSVCASPKGPLETGPGERASNNFKTLLHSAIFVVNTVDNVEVASERVVLTESLAGNYRDDAAAQSLTEERMPLLPTEILVAAPDASGRRQAFLSAMGSSAVYPVAFAADGTASVGSAGKRFIDLGRALPIGMAVLSEKRGLVLDDLKPGLRAIDLASSIQVSSADTLGRDGSTGPLSPVTGRLSDEAREGRRLFSTGLTAWSFQGQAWSSCESCHPDGLSDGVTWRFARGPRRTISVAGTYYRDEPTRRVMLWGGNIDEIHDVEAIARNLSGGVGGVPWTNYSGVPGKDCRLLFDGKNPGSMQPTAECAAPLPTTLRANGLNGSLAALSSADATQHCNPTDIACDINPSRDWANIDAFIRTVRAPRAPTGVGDEVRIAKGAALFTRMRCHACHAGSGWTLSQMFYEPGPVANGKAPFADNRVSGPDPSAVNEMLGLLRTQKYRVPAAAPEAFRPAPGVEVVPFRTAPREGESPFDYIFGQLAPAAGMSAPPPIPADQLKCALRSVGTFPVQPASPAAAEMTGVVPAGSDVPPIREVRRVLNAAATYDDKLAFGATGFNIPSLVGLATGAPYFHAGNARTLEELFDPAFAAHYGAMLPPGTPAPSSEDIRNLVTYLLSIDETGDSAPLDPDTSAFNPDLCAQFNAMAAP